MKKRIILLSLLVVISIFIITGCSNKKLVNSTNKENENTDIQDNNNTNYESEYNNMETITYIKVSINGKTYNAKLEDNETAASFAKLLPQEFNMNELNGNEKYIYIDSSLPTNSYNPKHIVAGDIMLYGNNCIVIFYESFDTSYSYSKIGHIDNLSNLDNGNITVTFTK